MSQRFMWCPHCRLPHDAAQTVCPATGKAIGRPSRAARAPDAAQQPNAAPPRRPTGANLGQRPAGRDLTGKTIGGKYLVRSVLGEGGMGSVFEAENITIGRAVAIKVLHPNQARKKESVKRFHHEARAAGAIGHPNICEVYDLGTLDDGSPYLVMEKLVGETLADRIAREGGLPYEDVIDFLTQVLSGLVAAHEKRIVHRDIKPENVFLTKRVGCGPVAKILDFGVSKMIQPVTVGERDEDLDLTKTGMVMGTPYYMSPEQARGERNLDARVDLYAAGVILYEALTGKRPFSAANYNALLLNILTGKPRSIRELRPSIPIAFEAVIEKAMARSRDDRYAHAAEFQRDLQLLQEKLRKIQKLEKLEKTVSTTSGPPGKGGHVVSAVVAAAGSSAPVARSPSHTVSKPNAIPVSKPATPAHASPPAVPPSARANTPAKGKFRAREPSSVEIPVTFVPDPPSSPPPEVVDDPTEVEARGLEMNGNIRDTIPGDNRFRSVPPGDDADTLVRARRSRRPPPGLDDTIKTVGDLTEPFEDVPHFVESSPPPPPPIEPAPVRRRS